jgi:hypothetical protein
MKEYKEKGRREKGRKGGEGICVRKLIVRKIRKNSENK